MRPIYAARLTVSPRPDDGEPTFDRVVAFAHRWLAGGTLPGRPAESAAPLAGRKATVAPDRGLVEADHLSDGSRRAWRGAAEGPAPGSADRRHEAQVLELPESGACQVTLRLLAGGAGTTDAAPDPPPLVPALLGAFAVRAGSLALSARPWKCATGGIGGLVGDLLGPERTVPIVVVSRRADGGTAVDPGATARCLAGVARVVVLAEFTAALELTRRLGRALSCYDGALRVYWPGFARGDDRYHHLLLTAAAVAEYASPAAVSRTLLRRIAAVAADRIGPDVEVEVLARLGERRAPQVTPPPPAAIPSSRGDGEWAALLALASVETAGLEARVAELEHENDRLTAAIAAGATWRDAFPDGDPESEADAEDTPDPSAPAPATPAEAVRLALAAHAGPHVEFADSAVKSAEKTPFQGRAQRVYAALVAICEVAALYHAGRLEQTFEDAFRERGQAYRRDVSPTALGLYGDHYTFSTSKGRVVVGPHLALGRGNAATSMRIYWHVDETERRFYLCHVGRHLPDTTT